MQDTSPATFEEVCTFLNPFVEFRKAEQEEIILEPGKLATHLVIVLKGVIRSVQYTSSGIELFSYYFTKGQPVFLVACVTGTKSVSYFVADRSASLAYIPKSKYMELLEINAEFKDTVLRHICFTSEALIRHLYTIQFKKARHRICSHLINMCKDIKSNYSIPFNLEKLANYLNLARPTLSKEIHLLQDEGAITLKKNLILISNLDKLYKILNE